MSARDDSKLPFDAYQAFEDMLREQFGISPEKALERINRELAENPLTRGIRLELPPKSRNRSAG